MYGMGETMDSESVQTVRAEDLICPIRDGKNCRGKKCAWCISLEFGDNVKDACSIAAIALVEFMKHYDADMVVEDG